LKTGDRITYLADGGTVIGGLQDERGYGVIYVNGTTIKLGVPFKGTNVDSTQDVIRFDAPHGLNDGERLKIGNDGGPLTGGLAAGQDVYVRVIDDRTVKLARTQAEALATTKTFAAGAVNASTDLVTLAGHGFAANQAVTYRGPRKLDFYANGVDVTAETIALGTESQPHGLVDGDQVVYRIEDIVLERPTNQPAAALGGLSANGTYFVKAVDATTVKLATSAQNLANGVFVNLSVSSAAQLTKHSLQKAAERAITGLVDGQTYYVLVNDADSFRLAATAGGTALDINATGAGGTHRIGTEGIELDGAPLTGQQWLAYDIMSAGAGMQRLLGAGGISASLDALGADGVSRASSQGPSYSLFISGGGADSNVTVSPTVTAGAGVSAQLTAGNDVGVISQSFANGAVSAGTSGGAGLAGLGTSNANVIFGNTVTSRLADGSSITAGHDVDVTADSRHTAIAEAVAGAVSLGYSSSGAYANVQALPTTTVDVGAGARILADNDVDLRARTGAGGSADANASGGAFIGGGTADARYTIGTSSTDAVTPRTITVAVGANANVRAQRNLNVDAGVDDTQLVTTSYAGAGGFGVDPDAVAVSIVNTLAVTRIDSGAHLTGVENARIVATHTGIATEARPTSWGAGAVGSADADAWSMHRVMSRIIGEPDAVVASKNVDVFANVSLGLPIAAPSADKPDLSLVSTKATSHFQPLGWDRYITWNADTVLLSAPTPELLVNASGSIVVERGLDAVDLGDRIVVNDISNDGNAGSARFRVNPSYYAIDVLGTQLKGGVNGKIDGDQGTLTVRHTWETVNITNLSTKDLIINDIDPVDRSGTATVRIDADENEFHFDIAHEYGPTRIDIANLGSAGTPDIVFEGVVNNPLGLTEVINRRGDIRSSASALIRTNVANIEVEGDIASTAARLALELVESEGRTPTLAADAGGDMALQLRLLDRNAAAGPLALGLGTLDAGGDVDVLLLPALEQTTVSAAPSGYTVTVTWYQPTIDALAGTPGPASQGTYLGHYQSNVGGPVFVPSMGIFGTGATAVDSLTTFGLVRAGGDIRIAAAFGSTRMTLAGTTDLTGDGAIDAYTNGDITLAELAGDMRVGRIVSTTGDVFLTSPAGIVDALGDAQADVLGRRIVLRANGGGIGSHLNDLEIDSQLSGSALVLALAQSDVFLVETAGPLAVERVDAAQGEIRLTTRDSAAAGEDIVVGAGAEVTALLGSVTLQSGDDIAVTGRVFAHDPLVFAVDHRNADAGAGGHLSLTGEVAGSHLTMLGDDDDDVLIATGLTMAVTGWGRRGNDILRGGRKDDDLYGGEGADEIDGDEGDDLLVADAGVGDVLKGGSGNDRIFGSEDGAEADPDFGDALRFGDRIEGGEGDDVIHGLGGADDIDAGAGIDWVDGGLGGDRIVGGAGADTLYGSHGGDTILGHGLTDAGDDDAADRIYGEWGDDVLSGQGGLDLIEGGFGNDHLFGGRGDDVLHTGFGLNTADGGEGDDQIHGSDDGADTLLGGAGRDRLWGYAGNDTLNGGADDDILDGGAGDDLLQGAGGSDVLVGGADHDTLYGHFPDAGAQDDNAVDTLYGDFGTGLNEAGSGRDRLYGQGGNDLLFGEGGDDLIEGVAGFVAVESSGGSGNVIDFGDALDNAAFSAPTATAAPALQAIDFSVAREAATLPDGMDHRGRWADLGGSASDGGVSGSGILSREPQVATAPDGSAVVVWTDTRAGVPQIYAARHGASGWIQLGTSASARGVSDAATPAYAPSVAIDAQGRVVVAWTQETATGREIRVARFDPAAQGGTGAWESLGTSLAAGGISGSGQADGAKVVVTANGPAVIWLEGAVDAKRIYAKIFTGGTWQALGTNGASGGGIAGGAVTVQVEDLAAATDGTRVAVAWTHIDVSTGARQAYLRELVSGNWTERAGSGTGSGMSGSTDGAYAGTLLHNARPTLAYHAGSLFAAWQTFSDEGAAITVAEYAGNAAPQVRGTFDTPELRSDPVLTSGGGVLRLLWTRTAYESSQTQLYAARYTGVGFIEEAPGDASGAGLSLTGGSAQALAAATNAGGLPIVAWQDAASGVPGILARGSSVAVSRTFIADASTGVTLQQVLDSNDLGLGDLIVVHGAHGGPFTISAQDAGVTIVGAEGAVLNGPV
ncbi:MAG: hypothetical protein JNL33_01380, partial [Betaproteobacteria bacterium]|nr:hypothetical protein [Betaproteobacteria bacterium]